MQTDSSKTRDELLVELQRYRVKALGVDALKEQLNRVEDQCRLLQSRLEQRDQDLARECADHHAAVKELGLAQLIVDRSPVILFRRKAGDTFQMDYISVNLRNFGYAPEEFINGKLKFRDIIYRDDRDRVREEVLRFQKADLEEYSQQYRLVTKSGEIRWVYDQTSVVRDKSGTKIYNQGILIDITVRKSAEEKLRKSEEKFRRIVETAAEGFLLMDENLQIVDVNEAYCRMVGYTKKELIGKTPLDLMPDTSRGYILANKETLFMREHRQHESHFIAKDGRRIPILAHGNTLRDDQGTIIGNVAFCTDMTEHKKALILAGEVQKSLLPSKKPHVRGLDIAGRNVSCDEIGGDYFDFLWRHDSSRNAFSIVVGDISGHGVESALLMTTARAFLRMRAAQPGTISEIISEMNNHLVGDILDSGKFMTLFYLSIDPDKRELNWVRAGHDPALIYTPSTGEFEELKGSGLALGVIDGFRYISHQKNDLNNGQIIAIGTDGIWEAINTNGQMFGKKRLRDTIRKYAGESADDILNQVYVELNQFMSGTKPEDDITLVIVKVEGLPEKTSPV
ncbi:RsbP [Desulforapulum autotrophicum HRM2]|uniref:RsbP n=1 Tax=Desulforapulum autotrophicum (strain ATCC 43914 / DSM 3382 / VKM B-1955 / HRM2) TaxID=177437 RepID=C0QJS4_DESAH|nr:SpoIIE family protein phosphatase [Desulforapulum autotrophicum]ACN13927.1 RsbP [Desulforapulum autotrophicum HRM2]